MYSEWNTLKQKLISTAWLLLFLSLLANLCMLALPIYTLQIFDRVITSQSSETLIMLAAALAISGCAHIYFDTLRRRVPINFSVYLQQKVSRTLGNQRDSKNNQRTADLETMASTITSPVAIAATDALWTPLFVILLFALHPALGAVLLVVNALLTAIIFFQQYHLKRKQQKLQKHRKQYHQQQKESDTCQDTLLGMGMAADWQAYSNNAHQQKLQAQQSVFTVQQRYTTTLTSLKWLLQSALPTVGAVLLIEQAITPGTLLAALIIGFRGLLPFEVLLTHWQSVQQAQQAWKNIRQHLHQKSGTQTVPPVALKGDVQITQLHAKEHLKGIDLTLPAGQCMAIIGANGAGKSLLMECLLGKHTLTSGQIKLGNCDIQHLDSEWLGKHIGYVSQCPQLPTATLRDHICRYRQLPIEEANQAMVACATQAGLHQWIMSLPNGYDTLIDNTSNPLSPGMQQRLALARALFGKPQLLLFDEADAAFDLEGVATYQQLLKQAKSQGITTVFVTQRRQLLTCADQVLVIERGQQAFMGAPERLGNEPPKRDTKQPRLKEAAS